MKIRLFGEELVITPLGILILLVIIFRIPNLFEPYWYGDEAIYLVLGEGVRQGLTLYKDLFDHKPPLIYLLAALAGSLFWFKFILLVSHSITVYLFNKLAFKILSLGTIASGKIIKSALIATIIFAATTTLPILEGHIANAELFLSLPIIGGLLFIFSQKRLNFINLFIPGLIFSLAVLFKIPAVFEIAALVVYWVFQEIRNWKKYPQIILNSSILAIGVFLPIAITGVWYWTQGALSQYLSAGLTINLNYVSSWSAPTVGENPNNLILRAEVLLGILLGILLLSKYLDKSVLFLTIWFSFTLFAALLSARPYPHYLIQTMAPLSLLVSTLVFGIYKQRFWTVPFLFLFLLVGFVFKFYTYPTFSYYANFISFSLGMKSHNEYFNYFDPRTSQIYEISKKIVSSTKQGDNIFIWGTHPELYALSRRLPPTRFVTSFHIEDFTGKEETIINLQQSPPVYIIYDINERRNFTELRLFMESDYLYLETIGSLQLWKKVSPSLIKASKQFYAN